jgi:glycosyltransferase A (GT-A) superfamily protein (DUF2064 family)
MNKLSKTAILLFNQSEKQKASLRKMAPKISEQRLKSLIAQLNCNAKKVCRKSGLPVFQVDANGQENFGAQLFQAYQRLFQQGFDSVIGISNDCPSFEALDVEKAAHAFQHNNLVLGPAKDGGLYLLGIQKNSISEAEFLALPWQSGELHTGFQQLAVQHNWSVKELQSKADMDTVKEFQIAFQSHFHFLIAFQNQLFSFSEQITNIFQTELNLVVRRTRSLRAPPLV